MFINLETRIYLDARINLEASILIWKHNEQVGNIIFILETSEFIWKHRK